MNEILEMFESTFSSGSMQWLLPIIILLVFVLFFRVFANIIQRIIHALLKKIGLDLTDDVTRVIVTPIRLLILVSGIFIATKTAVFFPDAMRETVEKLSQAVILFFFFQIIYLLMSPLNDLLARAKWLVNAAIANFIVKLLRMLVVLIGAVSILELFGIQVAPIIAGFGLVGAAVALGAQDLFKNLISGFLLLSEKRFDVGDWIKVEGVIEGTIEDIGFRSTLIRRFDKAPVHLPNNELANNALVNFTRVTSYRLQWVIGLEYRTTTPQLRKVRDDIENMLLARDDIMNPGEASFYVRVDKFSDSSIDIIINCFTTATEWADYLAIKEMVAYEVKKIVEESGTAFAFPSRSLYIEQTPSSQNLGDGFHNNNNNNDEIKASNPPKQPASS